MSNKSPFLSSHHTDSIPSDLKDPFYTDQYEQEHLKPPVASLLLSADLYCRAGSLILKSDASKPLLGHDAVIQALAQRGLYVTDQERLVTERDLRKRPLQMVGGILFLLFRLVCLYYGTLQPHISPIPYSDSYLPFPHSWRNVSCTRMLSPHRHLFIHYT